MGAPGSLSMRRRKTANSSGALLDDSRALHACSMAASLGQDPLIRGLAAGRCRPFLSGIHGEEPEWVFFRHTVPSLRHVSEAPVRTLFVGACGGQTQPV